MDLEGEPTTTTLQKQHKSELYYKYLFLSPPTDRVLAPHHVSQRPL